MLSKLPMVQLNEEENTMPAFTFEKISPVPRALHHSPAQSPASQTQDRQPNRRSAQAREAMVQVLGRFVEARVRDDSGLEPPPRRPLPK